MKFYFLIIPFVFGCQEKPKSVSPIKNEVDVKSIAIVSSGGMLGHYSQFVIQQDSLFFESQLAADSTKNKKKSKVNPQYKLQDILNGKEIEAFSKIKSGASRQPVDGIDTNIIVKTNDKEYSVVNGYESKEWEEIQNKMYQILEKEFNANN